jgi:hypothetical protein
MAECCCSAAAAAAAAAAQYTDRNYKNKIRMQLKSHTILNITTCMYSLKNIY